MPNPIEKTIMDRAYQMITKEGYSARQTSTLLGIDDGTMRKRLKRDYGHIFLPDGKKYVDSNFFNSIDTELKAYWLGFLTADGYVSNRNQVELCLAEIDGYHVENFKKAIKSDHKIGSKKTILNGKEFLSYRISIKDKNMSSVLRSYGLTNKKSYEGYIPRDIIPNELMRHYIRGLLDGDGTITVQGKKQNRYSIGLTTASFTMAEAYIYVLHDFLRMYPSVTYSMGVYDLYIHRMASVELMTEWLYSDATVYLERKYEKIIAVLSQRSQETQNN